MRTRFVWWTALPLLLPLSAAAAAQDVPPAPPPATAPPADENQIVTFSAEHEGHIAELVALQQRAHVERIGFDQVNVGVAEAGVKLDGHLLAVGDFQRGQY